MWADGGYVRDMEKKCLDLDKNQGKCVWDWNKDSKEPSGVEETARSARAWMQDGRHKVSLPDRGESAATEEGAQEVRRTILISDASWEDKVELMGQGWRR